MITQQLFTVKTSDRGWINITAHVSKFVEESSAEKGLCNVYLHHTSASLIINENADRDVENDLEAFFTRLIPDGDPLFKHIMEGPDDMPSHIRTALTQTSVSIPISDNKLSLGTWQAIYLWEHRFAGSERKFTVTIIS